MKTREKKTQKNINKQNWRRISGLAHCEKERTQKAAARDDVDPKTAVCARSSRVFFEILNSKNVSHSKRNEAEIV